MTGSRAQDPRCNSVRRTSATLTFTTICESKSAPESRSRYSCVLRAKQYEHAWLQPRYGFTVQSNGMADAPGTRFRAVLHSTSWNVIPANSGVVTDRTRPSMRSMPGSAAVSSTPNC